MNFKLSEQTLWMIAGILCVIAIIMVIGSRHYPRPTKQVIGGCKGTQFGCCPNGRTACNRNCSNCYYS